jgi:acetyl-CoA synthetase
MRGGKSIPLKQTVDKALTECPGVKHVLVFSRAHTLPTPTPLSTSSSSATSAAAAAAASIPTTKVAEAAVPWVSGRDEWAHDALSRERPYCPPEWMDAEDPLFFLYTSGSTVRRSAAQGRAVAAAVCCAVG